MKTDKSVGYIPLLLKRLLPSIVVLSVLLFFNGPMAIILANRHASTYFGSFIYYSYFNKFIAYACAFVLPLIFSSSIYDYMFSEKIADFKLSLPITRRTQLLSGMVASTVATIIPIAINLLITIGIYSFAIPLPSDAGGATLGISYIFLEILMMFLIVMSVSAVCAFVAVYVGTRLEHFVYSCAVIFMPMIISVIPSTVTKLFIYGYDLPFTIDKIADLSMVSSAANFALIYTNNTSLTTLSPDALASSIMKVFVSFVLCMALFVIGYLRVEKRKGEYSGRKGVCSVLSIFVNIILSFMLGIIVSVFFFEIMNIASPGKFGIGFCLMGAFFAVIAYTVIDFILTQNIKNFKRNIPFLIITVSFFVVLFIFDVTGGFGTEKRLPDVDDIDYVTTDYSGFDSNYSYYEISEITNSKDVEPKITSKDSIDTLLALHKKSLQNINNWDIDYARTSSISVDYHLKNGKIKHRYFDTSIDEKVGFLQNLHDDKEFNENAFSIFYLEPQYFNDVKIETYKSTKANKTLELSKDERQQIIDAMRSDVLSTINSESIAKKGDVIGKVTFTKYQENDLSGYIREYNVTVSLRKSYTKTIALLKQFGYELPDDEQMNVSRMEIHFPSSEDISNSSNSLDSNIYLDSNEGVVIINSDQITPELVDDVLENSLPEGSLMATLDDPILVNLFYGDGDVDDESYLVNAIYLAKDDINNIISKYNVAQNN